MASEKMQQPLEKPLTTAQVNEMMYRRYREHARMEQQYREKYEPKGPGTQAPGGSTGATGPTGTNAPNSNSPGKK